MALRDWLERLAGGGAELYDGVVGRLDRTVLAGVRRTLLADLSGNVLELGSGTGSAFDYYSAGARVTAIEPEPAFRRRALLRARQAPAEVRVLAGDAHDLPFADGSFDAVVAELMLCSVAYPERVLSEARRTLRAGGRLRLLEHVRHPHPWLGRLQDVVDPLWTQLEGRGCHIGRDTPSAVEAAGFRLTSRAVVPLPPGIDWLFPIVTLDALKD